MDGHHSYNSLQRQESMSDRRISTTTMMPDSAFVAFKVNYEQAKHLATGEAVRSDIVYAGGHTWRLSCYPRGYRKPEEAGSEVHLALYLRLMNRSAGTVRAIFQAFLLGSDGQPSHVADRRTRARRFKGGDVTGGRHGWSQFVPRDHLEKNLVADDGHITFFCSVMVVDTVHPTTTPVPVPPSDIGTHLGMLLDTSDGWDVAFSIQGETFHAHRAILAARSLFFRAMLLAGSMAAGEDTRSSSSPIVRDDITPATFSALLQFVYTDALPSPRDDELGDAPSEMFRCLLAAADMYELHRLKLMCAQKLWEIISVDTAAATLSCALMYQCPELKEKCIDFFAMEGNFRNSVLTEDFVQLGHKFPSIIRELKKRVPAMY